MEETRSMDTSAEEHEHPDLTREYEIITQVMTDQKEGRRNVDLKQCRGCEDLSRCAIPYADAYESAFAQSEMPCTVACNPAEGKRLLQLSYEGEIFMQIIPATGEILQFCHDGRLGQSYPGQRRQLLD